MQQWYVVYTQTNFERKVTALIKRKGIDCFTPYNTVFSAKEIITEPLFPSYAFLCASEAELKWALKIKWVINTLFFLKQPVILDDRDVQILRSFVTNHNNIKIAKTGFGFYQKKAGELNEPKSFKDANSNDARKDSIILSALGVALIAEKESRPVIVLERQIFNNKFLFKLAAKLHLYD